MSNMGSAHRRWNTNPTATQMVTRSGQHMAIFNREMVHRSVNYPRTMKYGDYVAIIVIIPIWMMKSIIQIQDHYWGHDHTIV